MSMTEMTVDSPVSVRRSVSGRSHTGWLIFIVTVLSIVMSSSTIRSVWQNNTFSDPDDAMQLVEVRGLISGQDWFDLTVKRLDPPHGVFMHWSRLSDAPLALLIRGLELFLPVSGAERLARIVFPLILLSLLYIGVARLSRQLLGPGGVLPALVLALLSCAVFSQFEPGHITHSATQVVLLLFMTCLFVEACEPARWRRGVICGALAALSLGISVENLPAIGVLSGTAVLLWVASGVGFRRPLLSFGAGLGFALPLVFVGTIARARWFDRSCDALSYAYLVPALAGAAAIVSLAALSPRLRSWQVRLGAALLAAGAVVLASTLNRPGCFLDPYAGIDPLLRDVWLAHVEEAQPLLRFFATRTTVAIILVMPIVLGLTASLVAVWRERGLARRRWIIVAAMTGSSFALCFLQIRLVAFACPLAVFGCARVIVQLRDHLRSTPWREAASLAFLLVLPFSSIGWALALPSHGKDSSAAQTACLATSAFTPLIHLPAGLVAGPIDAGSHILALTPHTVLAAPYHRDNHGNRVALDAFLAAPDDAHEILRANGVTYVVDCRGFGELSALAKRAPASLAAQIVAGTPPAWLSPLPRNGPLQVLVMRP